MLLICPHPDRGPAGPAAREHDRRRAVAAAVPRARPAVGRRRAGQPAGGPPGGGQADTDRARRQPRRAGLRAPRDDRRRPARRAPVDHRRPAARPSSAAGAQLREVFDDVVGRCPDPTRCWPRSTSCAGPSTPAGPNGRSAASRRPHAARAAIAGTDAGDRADATAAPGPDAAPRTPRRRSGAAYTRPAPAGPGVGWLRRLGPFIRRYRGTVIATLVFSVVAQTLIGLLPLIQQVILDHSIISHDRAHRPAARAARAHRRVRVHAPTTPAGTSAPR